ncbi:MULTISPECIES: AAA family ATPase [Rhizobium]|uniref:AAA family ATPase n=1 Tax=Rhizobium TaxID=379 RepID=UPI0019346F09|nr:AAA family ATPase [Rhizobium rosettiformans]
MRPAATAEPKNSAYGSHQKKAAGVMPRPTNRPEGHTQGTTVMNDMMGASPNSRWHEPEPSQRFLAKHSPEEVAVWRDLRSRVVDIAAKSGWTKSETGRRMGIKESTFSQWISGTLEGILENTNTPVMRWLDGLEDSAGIVSVLPQSPGFLMTYAAAEIHRTLTLAQTLPGFVTVTLDAGRGKTVACEEFARDKPTVHMVTLHEKASTVTGAINMLARQMGVRVFNQGEVVEIVGEKLKRSGNSLLIVDEAQHADRRAVNQFRHFSDRYKTGVALVGNADIRRRINQEGPNAASRDQIVSRIDKNLKRDPGKAEDVRTFIEAWGVTDASCVRFLTGLGMKGGALRQIDRTIKIACLAAKRPPGELEKKHIEAAWRNRDVEDV